MKRQPNVLLILTDEQRFDAVGFNGNQLVRTPHLDALASRSVNFTRHTCSSPICTPARASLLTGCYPRAHGAVGVGTTLPPTVPTLANWLGQAGYCCGLFGKSHLESELSGFAERLPPGELYYGFHRTGLSEDNLIGPYMDWIRREHPQFEAAVWTQAHENIQAEHGGHDFSAPDTTRLAEVYPSPVPFELSQSLWITRQTERFIREQQTAGTPFFAVCSYVPPHHPGTPPEPYSSLYRPAEMPVGPRLPADYVSPWPLSAYNHLPQLPDSELQRYVAAYYGLCTMLDECIGRLLQAVRDCGADENTIIIFTSDHGDYNGEFGLIRKLGPLFDCLLRVPLLIHRPGQAANGLQCAGVTQHEDLAPTILDLLEMPRPKNIQGITLAAALENPSFHPRPHSFFELATGGGLMAHGVSDGEWKLLNYSAVGDVLVQPAHESGELLNQAGETATAAVQTALQQALYQWLLRTPLSRPSHEYIW